jgi:uncharacterized membrane protein
MKQLHTEIDVEAPAERVWEVLMDFASYPQWNPFIRNISSLPAPGSASKYASSLPAGGA